MNSESVVLSAFSFVTAREFGNQIGATTWSEVGAQSGDGSSPPVFRWKNISDSNYKDFGRLDPMCKMSVAAVELLSGQFEDCSPERKKQVAIILGSSSGSLATDLQFCKTIGQPGGASPVLFSYALPSTPIAEVAIRYGFQGPNYCFLAGRGSGLLALSEGVELLLAGEAQDCLCIGCDLVTPGLTETFPEAAQGDLSGPSGAWAFLLESGATSGLARIRIGKGSDAQIVGLETLSELCRQLRNPAGTEENIIVLPSGLAESSTLILQTTT
jgi:Beta-ketoacyl synthase, N-terminal domain